MSSDQVHSSRAGDPGWKYCTRVEGSTNRVKCTYCQKIMQGGITRGKEHLMAKPGQVTPCENCPKHVREELWAYYKAKKEKNKANNPGIPNAREVDLGGLVWSDDEDDGVEIVSSNSNATRGSQTQKRVLKGPMDMFCQLHQKLHAAGHYLNPEIFYDNPRLWSDLEVTNGLYQCIERLVPNKDDQALCLQELNSYKKREGLFGSSFAEVHRKTLAPAIWWEMYGLSAPTLMPIAIKILGLTCSSSGCERNWSVFEQLHSKKRNRLEHKKLHDLVYVKYNQKLNERHDRRNEIDPISLNDIDECNEWLVGEMDDEGAGNDLVFDDDNTLDWANVYDASGLGEPIKYTRRTSGVRQQGEKRKVPSSDISGSRRSKKGTTASSSKSKGRTLVDEDDEEFELDVVEGFVVEEEEQEDVGINEESEGEEEEGYVEMDDKEEENDYVGVDEED